MPALDDDTLRDLAQTREAECIFSTTKQQSPFKTQQQELYVPGEDDESLDYSEQMQQDIGDGAYYVEECEDPEFDQTLQVF